MSEQLPEFDGEEVQFGRTTKLVVPPLALGAVKKYAKRIGEFHTLAPEAQMELTSEIAFAALRRNYPDITQERVDELVDLRNMGRVFNAVVQTSGFEAKAAGNAGGGTSQSTGQPSTPSSQQP